MAAEGVHIRVAASKGREIIHAQSKAFSSRGKDRVSYGAPPEHAGGPRRRCIPKLSFSRYVCFYIHYYSYRTFLTLTYLCVYVCVLQLVIQVHVP